MANESATKPTYSELEVRAARWKKAARSYRSDMLTALGNWRINRERAEKAEADLVRVRGLLQRQSELAGQIVYLAKGIYGREKILALANEIAGAESADIGKLDTADKSGEKAAPENEIAETLQLAIDYYVLTAKDFDAKYPALEPRIDYRDGDEMPDWLAFAEDVLKKYGESREPAKLNNAQPFEQILESKAHQATCKHENAQLVCLSCGLGIQQGNAALAESSLSSPPQNSDSSAPLFPCAFIDSARHNKGETMTTEIRNAQTPDENRVQSYDERGRSILGFVDSPHKDDAWFLRAVTCQLEAVRDEAYSQCAKLLDVGCKCRASEDAAEIVSHSPGCVGILAQVIRGFRGASAYTPTTTDAENTNQSAASPELLPTQPGPDF